MFRRFGTGLWIRVFLLTLSMFACVYMVMRLENYVAATFLFIPVALQTYGLFHYVENTNRKLIRFLEAVRFSDFAIGFSSDNKLGESFKELNKNFNEVLDAFRQARSEKEEHLQYLNTVVQHVSVGLLAFDPEGNVELINNAACRLLGVYRLRHLAELQKDHPELMYMVQRPQQSDKVLYTTPNDLQLAVHATGIRLRGKMVKLVSLQNIQSELQQKELDAWQNLTRVLRHEIMNSITPIASLIATMSDIVEHDLAVTPENNEPINDIKEALKTIESRSIGLINFVNGYRSFTNIPKPKPVEMPVKELVAPVVQLMKPDLRTAGIRLHYRVEPADLMVTADSELIEMVLINLVKNAMEAVSEREGACIQIHAYPDTAGRVVIEVDDNGPGIIPEALEKIFIPFYTTKKTGSGIGLSLSRQIMQMHGGTLKANSMVGDGTTFTLKF
jgi:nitrogen fixation/metabolism regulation signal transduction histidine kinase